MVERVTVADLVQRFRSFVLKDEDGNPLRLRLRPGVSEERLAAYETAIGGSVPDSLRALLSLGNGMCLFGLDVLPCEALQYHPDPDMISFHAWGNGDFDCLALAASPFREGAVLFASHSPDAVVPVASSLEEWLSRVVEEITEKGTLLHPDDYRLRPGEHGLYEGVRRALDDACSSGRPSSRGGGPSETARSSNDTTPTRIRRLLDDPDLQHMDEAIANTAGYSVRRERVDLLLPFIEAEILASGLPLDRIIGIIKARSSSVVNLAVGFLLSARGRHRPRASGKPAGELAAGTSITYAIYYHFLAEEPEHALADYLGRRKVPQGSQVTSLLRQAFLNLPDEC